MSSSDQRGPTTKQFPSTPAQGGSGRGESSPLPLRRVGYALTDLGRKRACNEDAFFVDDALGLYIVADGMGGHAAGEVASREAVDTLHGMVKRGVGELRQLVDPVVES